ncbi:MAG TPA: protein-glutamate O-methyltransferase CheR [Limnochordia bacterium]|nr:protein-glutamate O-methyltransferase CheR [Limnochordia bacterium]
MTDYEKLKRDIDKALGIDLTSYKDQQMRRRINQWIERHRLNSYDQLIATLNKDQDHRQKFKEYLTINTSNFFRDTRVFDDIRDKVLPQISQRNRPRIWSAGASIGAEIYSIAILMNEAKFTPSLLLATDLDEMILGKAQAGEYLSNQIAGADPVYLEKYFSKKGNDRWVIDESIRKQVVFKKHDLLRSTYERNFDLILCRNVFIYFTSETQQRLITNFVQSLKPSGFFIVGSAEQIMDPTKHGLQRVSYCIYQKTLQ